MAQPASKRLVTEETIAAAGAARTAIDARVKAVGDATYGRLGTKGRVLDIEGLLPASGEDVTDALRSAVSILGGSGTIVLPAGLVGMISEPVDLGGCSLFGFDQWSTTLRGNPSTTNADWRIDPTWPYPNDTAMLYAFNRNNWSISGIGLDGNGCYFSAATAYGGSGIVFERIWSRNAAKPALQFMGARMTGQLPVTHSTMRNNLVEDSVWNLVLDGANHNVSIVNNVSRNAVLRHISIDPDEVVEESGKASYGLVISGNVCEGRRPVPAEWLDNPTNLSTIDFAIRIGTGGRPVSAAVTGNTIRNWTSPGNVNGAALSLGCTGTATGNVIENDDATGPGNIGIATGGSQPGLTIVGNTIKNHASGFQLPATEEMTIAWNRLVNVTTVKNSSPPMGAGTVFANNFSGKTAGGSYDVRGEATRYIPAGAMGALGGTPTLTKQGSVPVWGLDDTANESVGLSVEIPAGWSTMHVDYIWASVSGTGDVAFRFESSPVNTGAPVPDAATGTIQYATAATANRTTSTRVASDLAVTPGAIRMIEVHRVGSDSGDTIVGDVSLIGVRLTRV